MRNYRKITIRFDMDIPEQRKAWEIYLNRDRRKYRSAQNFFAEAINSSMDQQEQCECVAALLAEKLIQNAKISFLRPGSGRTGEKHSDENDFDWDFLGSL